MNKKYSEHVKRLSSYLKSAQADKNLTQEEIKQVRARCEEIKKILNEGMASKKSSQTASD